MLRILVCGLCLVMGCLLGCNSEDPLCGSAYCAEHGVCLVVSGQPACQCDRGFVADGLACITDPCSGTTCVFGTCQTEGGRALCACEMGYTGETCERCAEGYHEEGLQCLPTHSGPCDPQTTCSGLSCSYGDAASHWIGTRIQ